MANLPTANTPAVRRVAVRDPEGARDCQLATGVLTGDPWAVVEDPAVDIVVEVMGGLTPAAELMRRAIELGKPVVTANKAVLGAFGPALRAVAPAQGTPLLFEAAVAGVVPLIRGLSGLLRADKLVKIEGVLNGTTTFLLSHMERTAATLDEALAEARRACVARRSAAASVHAAAMSPTPH